MCFSLLVAHRLTIDQEEMDFDPIGGSAVAVDGNPPPFQQSSPPQRHQHVGSESADDPSGSPPYEELTPDTVILGTGRLGACRLPEVSPAPSQEDLDAYCSSAASWQQRRHRALLGGAPIPSFPKIPNVDPLTSVQDILSMSEEFDASESTSPAMSRTSSSVLLQKAPRQLPLRTPPPPSNIGTPVSSQVSPRQFPSGDAVTNSM